MSDARLAFLEQVDQLTQQGYHHGQIDALATESAIIAMLQGDPTGQALYLDAFACWSEIELGNVTINIIPNSKSSPPGWILCPYDYDELTT